jgi:hypothetical protein
MNPEELPLIAHSSVAQAFMRDNPAFLRSHDSEGKRWDKWDLRRAVSEYLARLFGRYEAPKRGRDPRLKMLSAGFRDGVVREVRVVCEVSWQKGEL